MTFLFGWLWFCSPPSNQGFKGISSLLRRSFDSNHASLRPRPDGLLSTSTLLNLFEIKGEARRRLESQVRRQSQTISHAKYGSAVVRDQKPIVNEERLRKCVQGATPEEWLRLLNSKVFFWVNCARLNGLRSARAYRGRQHLVLTLNTRKLVTAYLPSITLCPMNSGNCLPYPHPRSPTCFASIQDFDYAGWRAKRGGREIVVECAVDGSVKNVEQYLLRQEIV